jgi:hypothetical protein
VRRLRSSEFLCRERIELRETGCCWAAAFEAVTGLRTSRGVANVESLEHLFI